MIKKIIPPFIALLVIMTSKAFAVPVVDGKFDPLEGYTTGLDLVLQVESGPLVSGGKLWLFQDPTTHDMFVNFIEPLTLVDNSYGLNAIGWGAAAPSGKGHKFKDLKGSDKAQFQFTDKDGAVVLDVVVDYISETSKGSGVFGSLGVTGGDGKVLSGDGAKVLAWGTSLDYNFNTLGLVLTADSPLTDPTTSYNVSALDPNSPTSNDWIFEVIYELQVDGSLFGSGGVTMEVVHNSPNKQGKNVVTVCTTCVTTPIPEPATLFLLGTGLAGLGFIRRRKKV